MSSFELHNRTVYRYSTPADCRLYILTTTTTPKITTQWQFPFFALPSLGPVPDSVVDIKFAVKQISPVLVPLRFRSNVFLKSQRRFGYVRLLSNTQSASVSPTRVPYHPFKVPHPSVRSFVGVLAVSCLRGLQRRKAEPNRGHLLPLLLTDPFCWMRDRPRRTCFIAIIDVTWHSNGHGTTANKVNFSN
jgi:hypothetical protein